MSRTPSRSGPPSGYPREPSHHPYAGGPPSHHPQTQYSLHPPPPRPPYASNPPSSAPHPPVDRDPYHRPPHFNDPYYYPQHAPYSYAPPTHQHPDYRPLPQQHHNPLVPRPHPPAPPAPPRQQQYREPQGTTIPHRPNLVPTFNYYRSHVEYEAQHTPPRPNPPSDPHLRVHDEQRSVRARSGSSASGYGSAAQEVTPSPIDPDRIQRWEEEHAPSHQSGSYHGDDRDDDEDDDDGDEDDDDNDAIGQTLGPGQHPYYSPSGQGQAYGGSPMGNVPELETDSAGLTMPNSQKRPNSDYYPSPHHQAQFAALTNQTGPVNTQRGRIGLNSLVDGEPGDRPAYPIPTIIKCAILGSPHQQLTLSELYLAMEMRFDYYKSSDKKSWRNSVRHNLSLNNQFDKKARPITEPGKGHYWVVVPDMPQGNKRERKRNKKPGKRALAAMAAQEEAERLARENAASQQVGSSAGPSSGSTAESPLDPQLTATTVVYPAAVRGHTSGTLPATAGSYAAVTGALPAPPPIDKQLYRPWNGDGSPTSPRSGRSGNTAPLGNALEHQQYSASAKQQASGSHGNRPQRHAVPERRQTSNAQPQFGESSLRPAAFGTPARRPAPAPLPRESGSGSTESSSSGGGGGPERSSTTRVQRRYDPTSPVRPPGTSAPANAFSTLAAQIEREGLGTTGSGGPALSARGKQSKGKGRGADENESDSDGDDLPSDDDEYVPRRSRKR